MKVCVVGGGGTEHALAHALGRCDHEVVVTPGNPGIPGEAQVVLPLLTSDLGDLLAQAAVGSLRDEPVFADDAAVTVVLTTQGYPTSPRTGDLIGRAAETAAATVAP